MKTEDYEIIRDILYVSKIKGMLFDWIVLSLLAINTFIAVGQITAGVVMFSIMLLFVLPILLYQNIQEKKASENIEKHLNKKKGWTLSNI